MFCDESCAPLLSSIVLYIDKLFDDVLLFTAVLSVEFTEVSRSIQPCHIQRLIMKCFT